MGLNIKSKCDNTFRLFNIIIKNIFIISIIISYIIIGDKMHKQINLVLQGGGIKGLVYIGALRYLEEQNYEVNYISGSSVGAVIGSLIAAGYDSYELEDIVNNMPLDILINKNNLKDSLRKKGLNSIEGLENYVDNLLIKKGKRVFNDFKIGNNYKIIIISTSINFKRIFVLPYDLKLLNINPDSFPVAKAVAMSASMPLFYEPYKINGYAFYDGGVSDNYPKWCFSNALALKVSQEKKIITNLKTKVFGFINNPNTIKEVYIDTSDYKAIDFKKGLHNKYVLYNRGYYTIKNYLEKKDNS